MAGDRDGDSLLARLQRAQERVEALKAAGVGMTTPEARRAVNALVTQLRHAPPDVLAAFSAWKAERGYR